MKRFLKLLFLVPLVLVAVVLAEANRHPVIINLDPLAGPAPEGTQFTAPLFVVIFLAIMVGVICGGVATYLELGRHRRAARQARAEAESLRAQVARLSVPRPDDKRKIP
ncbi:MAG: lipopolysaccharide assembly protein LapA domain-containing protein [Methylocella sp.]